MKSIIRLIGIFLFVLAVLDCGTQKAYSPGSLTLDAAIDEVSAYFIERLPQGAKVAVMRFDAPSVRFSGYVFEEVWRRFEDSGRFVMVDRKNLDRVETEIKYQLETGKVDDELAVSITKQYGAEILVYGQIAALGNEYRMTIYATDVEKAASSQRVCIIRPDSRLAALFDGSLNDEVDRAVFVMADALERETVVAVGRISYTGTDTVSGFSAWLKSAIIDGAQKYPEKFKIATESEYADFTAASRSLTADADGAVQAVITGNYSPLDSGAEVTLRLISVSGNKNVLSTASFGVSSGEMERRKLTLLPEQNNTVVSAADFAEKQQAVAPYAGKNNQWVFTVTPDTLDGIYYTGDFMSMQVYSERDCYFRIIHTDVNGSTQIIYPSSPDDDNFLRAGQVRRIPDNTRFRMQPPFGEEMILAAAYERPFTVAAVSEAARLNADTIARSLPAQGSDSETMSPSATSRFSYTILPR